MTKILKQDEFDALTQDWRKLSALYAVMLAILKALKKEDK